MSISKIAVDVDNVLADTMGMFCREASKVLGRHVSRTEIKRHTIVGSLPLSAPRIYGILNGVWERWHEIPLVESDTPSLLQKLLDQGLQVYIVTSRPSRSLGQVRRWLATQKIPHSVFRGVGGNQPKTRVPADGLVDDAPEQVEGYIRQGRAGFLYTQPWNERATIAGSIRIRRLRDIFPHLHNHSR